MALPTIAPYPMPAPAELPDNRVAWQVDPSRAVLLVHDLQNYFLGAYDTSAPPVPQLIDNISRLSAAAREVGMPVVYTAQPGGQTREQRGLQQDFWGSGLPDDPAAAAIVEDVAPHDDDIVLTKWKYSGFVRTDLAERLTSLGRDQIVITGVYAHIGVLMSAADAWMRDIQAFVVADAVADFSQEDHAMAMRWAAGRCAVVLGTDDIVTSMSAHPADSPITDNEEK